MQCMAQDMAAEEDSGQESGGDSGEESAPGFAAWMELLASRDVHAPVERHGKGGVSGIWCPSHAAVQIVSSSGKVTASMGYSSDKQEWLLPVEALYLLETGTLELHSQPDLGGVAWSCREGYQRLLPLSGGMHTYRAYRTLREAGVIVRVCAGAAALCPGTPRTPSELLPEVLFEVFFRSSGAFARSAPCIPAARVVMASADGRLPSTAAATELYQRCAAADVAALHQYCAGRQAKKRKCTADADPVAAEGMLAVLSNPFLPPSHTDSAARAVMSVLPQGVSGADLGRLLLSVKPLSLADPPAALTSAAGIEACTAALQWVQGKLPATVDAVAVPVWYAVSDGSATVSFQRLAPVALPPADKLK